MCELLVPLRIMIPHAREPSKKHLADESSGSCNFPLSGSWALRLSPMACRKDHSTVRRRCNLQTGYKTQCASMSDYDSDVEEGQELDLSNVRSEILWNFAFD